MNPDHLPLGQTPPGQMPPHSQKTHRLNAPSGQNAHSPLVRDVVRHVINMTCYCTDIINQTKA